MRRLMTLLLGLLLASGSAAAETGKRFDVAIVSRTVFYLPLWLAAEKGYFNEAGLDVRIQVFDNAEKIGEALRSGAANVAVSTPESIIVDAARGGSLRVVAGNAGKLPHFVIARPEIRSIADLRGKTIGVLSDQEGTTHLVPEVTRRAGLKPEDYQVKAVGGAPTRWRLLRSGEIDMGLQPFPLSYEAEAAGFTNLGALADYVPDWQFTSVNVDLRWAESNQQVLRDALRAMRRGLEAVSADLEMAVKVAARELQTSEALAARAIADTQKLGILTPGMEVSEPGLKRVHAALVAAGAVPAGGLELNKVVDTRFLQAAK